MLLSTEITKTVYTLSVKLVNSPDEDDREVALNAQKLTNKWKAIFAKESKDSSW